MALNGFHGETDNRQFKSWSLSELGVNLLTLIFLGWENGTVLHEALGSQNGLGRKDILLKVKIFLRMAKPRFSSFDHDLS